MKLYEISGRIDEILSTCVDEDGYMTQATAVLLDDLEDLHESKSIDIALYIKGEELEAEAIKSEATKLSLRAERLLKRAEWLRDYLAKSLPTDESINDPRVKIGWRKSTRVLVIDEHLVPEQFVITKIIRSVAKKAVREQLMNGVEVEGTELVSLHNLQIK